jgi:hypothetical protein
MEVIFEGGLMENGDLLDNRVRSRIVCGTLGKEVGWNGKVVVGFFCYFCYKIILRLLKIEFLLKRFV